MHTTTPHPPAGDAPGGATQTMLPLELSDDHRSAPERSDDADEGRPVPERADDTPIGFALTTRARRAVAPASLPPLSVVAGSAGPTAAAGADGALDEPGDTRPARARALRRAGVPLSEIARQLSTDTLTVAAWVGEVPPGAASPPGGHAAGAPSAAQPPAPADGATTEDDQLAHHLARAASAASARQRLVEDPAFALAVGILASIAEIDPHAITLSASGPLLVARALDAVTAEQAGVRARVRVIARVGPEAAGDLVRHRVATSLGLDVTQVSWTRWRQADRPDAVQLLVRIADPELAATVGGWVDSALDPVPQAATAWHA